MLTRPLNCLKIQYFIVRCDMTHSHATAWLIFICYINHDLLGRLASFAFPSPPSSPPLQCWNSFCINCPWKIHKGVPNPQKAFVGLFHVVPNSMKAQSSFSLVEVIVLMQ